MKLNKLLFASILILLAVLFRTVWHMGENIEFVTSAVLISSIYLGKKWAFLVPLITLLISDAILGNTAIFLFTWSAYLLLGMVSYYGYQLKKIIVLPKILTSTVFALSGSVWFFLWTNFGVWILDTHHMYEKNISGLLQSYLMGIPFLKNNLAGNLFFICISILLIEFVIHVNWKGFEIIKFNRYKS